MFVMTFALSWGVHGFLLQGDYMKMLGSLDAEAGGYPHADARG